MKAEPGRQRTAHPRRVRRPARSTLEPDRRPMKRMHTIVLTSILTGLGICLVGGFVIWT